MILESGTDILTQPIHVTQYAFLFTTRIFHYVVLVISEYLNKIPLLNKLAKKKAIKLAKLSTIFKAAVMMDIISDH